MLNESGTTGDYASSPQPDDLLKLADKPWGDIKAEVYQAIGNEESVKSERDYSGVLLDKMTSQAHYDLATVGDKLGDHEFAATFQKETGDNTVLMLIKKLDQKVVDLKLELSLSCTETADDQKRQFGQRRKVQQEQLRYATALLLGVSEYALRKENLECGVKAFMGARVGLESSQAAAPRGAEPWYLTALHEAVQKTEIKEDTVDLLAILDDRLRFGFTESKYQEIVALSSEPVSPKELIIWKAHKAATQKQESLTKQRTEERELELSEKGRNIMLYDLGQAIEGGEALFKQSLGSGYGDVKFSEITGHNNVIPKLCLDIDLRESIKGGQKHVGEMGVLSFLKNLLNRDVLDKLVLAVNNEKLRLALSGDPYSGKHRKELDGADWDSSVKRYISVEVLGDTLGWFMAALRQPEFARLIGDGLQQCREIKYEGALTEECAVEVLKEHISRHQSEFVTGSIEHLRKATAQETSELAKVISQALS